MSFTPSNARTKAAAKRRAKPYWITALYIVGISALLAFLPVLYGGPSKPGGRMAVLVLLVLFALTVFVFLLRYLFRRLHGENPLFRELLPAFAATGAALLAATLLTAAVTGILFTALRIPLSEDSRFGAETVTAAALNALLYPPLLCAPVAGLAAASFHNGFWRYGGLLRRGYLPILAAAIVCYGLNLLFTSVFSPALGAVVSVLLTTALHVFSIEWCMRGLRRKA